MIKKEFYKTREDGVNLYRIYSDTYHKIKSLTDNYIYEEIVTIDQNEDAEEVPEYISIDGPESYEDLIDTKTLIDLVTKKLNRLNLNDKEALSVKALYPKWKDKINNTIEVGFITLYNDKLWRAVQTHTVLEVYPPSMATASLYEVIELQHEGNVEDPIPYTAPMEIFEGKYYTEDDIMYKCTRSSGTSLSHRLSDLIGLYVEKI